MSYYGDHIDYNTGQKCECSLAISGGHYRGRAETDSLSRSCPTCDGDGYDLHSRMANRRPCPDCVDGVYPKAAVERAMWAVNDHMEGAIPEEWASLSDLQRHAACRSALAAIRAFHDEGSEG